jgi:hypothetical protein
MSELRQGRSRHGEGSGWNRVAVEPEAMGRMAPSPNACTHQGWSPDRIDELRRLWAEGLSAAQVAKKMGGLTRNAVIGKATG